jgi:hypothetical protein
MTSIIIILGFLISIYSIGILFKKNRIGSALYFFVLVLPFIHLIPYGLSDDILLAAELWGMFINSYMLNIDIIEITALIFFTSVLGFLVGIIFGGGFSSITSSFSYQLRSSYVNFRTIPSLFWFPILGGAILIGTLSLPSGSLVGIGVGKSFISQVSFPSGWLLSGIVFIFLYIDLSLDNFRKRRILKFIFWIIGFGYIIIFCQIYTGNREFFPIMFALLLFGYVFKLSIFSKKLKIDTIKIHWYLMGGVIFFLIAQFLGVVRGDLRVEGSIETIMNTVTILTSDFNFLIKKLFHGTWSAVLLTPLSVAGDYFFGKMEYKLGQSYLDLFLSVPPGFIFEIFNIERPLSDTEGPSFEMRFGQGGTHVSVVPFINFGLLGVFIILAFFGWLISNIEKKTLQKRSFSRIFLLISLISISPHWFWYGDKIALNCLIFTGILVVTRRVLIGLTFKDIR